MSRTRSGRDRFQYVGTVLLAPVVALGIQIHRLHAAARAPVTQQNLMAQRIQQMRSGQRVAFLKMGGLGWQLPDIMLIIDKPCLSPWMHAYRSFWGCLIRLRRAMRCWLKVATPGRRPISRRRRRRATSLGCACCAPRNAAGRALASLLQSRARGQTPFFRRVVACHDHRSWAGRTGSRPVCGSGCSLMFQAGFVGTSASPLPIGRCMMTTSSQRPNFTPQARITPAREKPRLACIPMEPMLSESPIKASIWR